ncbi:hypothetical protein RHS01_06255 [Rhizoctonia solani]|uniref:Uncharacterized protein n=1 Tax=Rhizoctonia solani TaxID=456999 RepID=A0A8H7M4K4_9AGAM|nr:hypothetical protein RHS01_06255 [Rhizoctonia solani]
MSSTAKTSTDAKMDVDDQKKKQIPALGVLEEDDEFEEFPAQGMAIPYMLSSLVRKSPLLADWEDRDTDIANLTNTSSGGRNPPPTTCGRIIGMTTTLRTILASSFGTFATVLFPSNVLT